MPIIDPIDLEGVEKPEIIFGLVAPVGTPLGYLYNTIEEQLEKNKYECSKIRLSEFLNGFNLKTPYPESDADEYDRLTALMDMGDELRSKLGGGEALSLLAASEINNLRPHKDPKTLPGKAFVLHQLKHPDEVIWLRTIYQSSFQLIAVYCPEEIRYNYLHVHRSLSEDKAKALIERDKGDEMKFGQQVTKTFQHADVFVELRGLENQDTDDTKSQIERYFNLLFGNSIITPTIDEYGMQMAFSASLKSADLSRQVGAAILNSSAELVSVGANDVPCYGGGQYWQGPNDSRDYKIGEDSNALMKYEILEEILECLDPNWASKGVDEKQKRIKEATKELSASRLMNLTEFGRAMHAEMEALLSAARIGLSVRNCDLFTTTFPCHNCAKHIVGAGIKRVVYIEPYPKSLADKLHSDSIAFSEDINQDGKVKFEPFRGIAPRAYPLLFSSQTFEGKRITRKTPDGYVNKEPTGLRLRASPVTHIDRESIVSLALNKITKDIKVQTHE